VTNVGGQAVLEGVMMRTPRYWAVAVRRPDGRISSVHRVAASAAVAHRWMRLPLIRGIVALVESLATGFRALSVSAQYSTTEAGGTGAAGEPLDDEPEELGRWAMALSFVIAIGFTIALFKLTPGFATKLIGIDTGTWQFAIVEGLIKVTILVGYLALLQFLPDLRRVFEYHAAEHKAINALEAGDPLEPAVVQRHSLIHVRCGTAFLLWVMLSSIVVFLLFNQIDRPSWASSWLWLILSRVLLLPLISAVAYEVIRFAGRHTGNRLVRAALAPGLWLQRLTTREPSLEQIEVSIAALRRVLSLEEERRVSTSRPVPLVDVMA
jgi:uncharacterized protein YqhQ